jgi:hypothetical protein
MGCILSVLKFEFHEPRKTDGKSSKYVSFLKIIILLSILIFILIWVYFKGNYYETTTTFESQTVMDQHGYFWTNFSKDKFDKNMTDRDLARYNRFWVPNDYVKQTDDLVFEIFTNFGISDVKISECAEDPQYDNVICNPDNNLQCQSGKQSPNGIQTGKCVPIEIPTKYIDKKRWHVCEVRGWCPVAVWPPLKHQYGAILKQTKDTFLTIQNFIQFPLFGVEFETENTGGPNCSYNPVNKRHCPYFKLGDIVKYSRGNSESFEGIAQSTGAIFEIKIEWNCSLNKVCKPEFSFWRRDRDNQKPHFWSFWEFEKLSPEQRVLTYGMSIKFYVLTKGYLKRLSLFNLAAELVAYFAIFVVAMTFLKCTVKFCSAKDDEQRFIYCGLLQKLKNLILHKQFAYNNQLKTSSIFVLSTIRSENSNGITLENVVEITN